eukprot:scaffold46038_cov63-Phaeocystis_antarctica.AAC.1
MALRLPAVVVLRRRRDHLSPAHGVGVRLDPLRTLSPLGLTCCQSCAHSAGESRPRSMCTSCSAGRPATLSRILPVHRDSSVYECVQCTPGDGKRGAE